MVRLMTVFRRYTARAVVLLVLAGCNSVEERPVTELAAGKPVVHPIPPVDTTASHLLNRLHSLTVSAPNTSCPVYESADYSYSSSLEYELVLDYDGVYDPYNDRWYTTLDSLSVLDIEHLVARKEGHLSGLCNDSVESRLAFARDSLNLALAHTETNRSKSDRDAAAWMPTYNRCWFVRRIVEVRERYQLTVDAAERDTLEHYLYECASLELETFVERPDNPLHDESPGCPIEPYPSCAALREDYPHGVYRTHCAYSERLDRDRDGWICLRG